MRCLLFGGFWLLAATSAPAQPLADTLFAWQGYAQPSTCHVSLYPAPPGDDRSHTVVIRELAENQGATTVEDARHLAELIGRHYGVDPTAVYWIFQWGAFSYEGAAPARHKTLFLRATFRRLKSQDLGSPQWRLLTREQVEDLTDRQFR